ncbi:MAG: TonB-dependent receptor, partial [Hymenobacter sp.]
SLDGSAGTRSATLNLNGGYRTGRMGFALGGFGRAGYNTPGSFSNDQLTTNPTANPTTSAQIRTTQTADTRQNQLFGRYTLGWDYDLSERDALAASLTYGTRNATTYQDALTTQATALATGAASATTRDVRTTDNAGTVDASLAYLHSYATAQRELSALALLSYTDRTYAFASNTYQATDATRLGPAGNDNPNTNRELTAQLDYQTPTAPNQLLEVGAKVISRQVYSDYTYSGQLAATQPGNSFAYRQQVAAGYVVYTLPLLKNLLFKPGLRYEHTTLGADTDRGPVGELPGYGALVPSASVLRQLRNGNVLKFSYNRRLQRPSLQFLNPNRQAANPFVQLEGNPLLRPEFTNNYELGYSTLLGQANLSFSVFARHTSGSIQSVRTPLTDPAYPGAVLITYENIGRESAYGGNVFGSLSVGTKLSFSASLDLYYLVLANNVPDPLYAARSAGLVAGGRLYGSYALPKGWNVQVFGFYRGQQVQLQGAQSNFAVYSMSVKHDVAHERGSIGLGAENFFSPRNAVRTDLDAALLSQRNTAVQHLTSFKVYFSYRVGQLKAEARARKRVQNDDLKTDENGGGSQGGGNLPDATRPKPAPASSPPAAAPAG